MTKVKNTDHLNYSQRYRKLKFHTAAAAKSL